MLSFLFYCAIVFILIRIKAFSSSHWVIVYCSLYYFVCSALWQITDYFIFSVFNVSNCVAEINVRSWSPPLDHRTRPPCLSSSEGWYASQYIMTDPSLCTAQINQTVVSDSKIQVFQTYHTNIPLRLVLYINVIFASFWLLKLTWLLPALFFTKCRQILLWTGGQSL